MPAASFKNSFKNNRGMTLIEIMIVLAIIGSLIAILAPNFASQQQKAKVKETKIIISKVSQALNQYFTDCGKFPASLESLVKADAECSNWGPDPYVKKLPKDSWNRDLIYSVEGTNFVIKSLGADGKEGGDGYNKDISSDDLE